MNSKLSVLIIVFFSFFLPKTSLFAQTSLTLTDLLNQVRTKEELVKQIQAHPEVETILISRRDQSLQLFSFFRGKDLEEKELKKALEQAERNLDTKVNLILLRAERLPQGYVRAILAFLATFGSNLTDGMPMAPAAFTSLFQPYLSFGLGTLSEELQNWYTRAGRHYKVFLPFVRALYKLKQKFSSHLVVIDIEQKAQAMALKLSYYAKWTETQIVYTLPLIAMKELVGFGPSSNPKYENVIEFYFGAFALSVALAVLTEGRAENLINLITSIRAQKNPDQAQRIHNQASWAYTLAGGFATFFSFAVMSLSQPFFKLGWYEFNWSAVTMLSTYAVLLAISRKISKDRLCEGELE